MFVGHGIDGHYLARLVGDVERLHTLAATVCHTVVDHSRTFAIALFAYHHDGFVFGVIHANHAYHFVVGILVQAYAAHAGCRTSHGAHRLFVEADGTAVAVGNDDFVRTVGQCHAHHAVVFTDVDGIHAVGTRTGVVGQQGLLDDTLSGTEDDKVALAEVGISQLAYVQAGIDGVVGLDVEHVLNGASLGVLCAFGQFIHLQPVAASLCREEEHRVVHRGRIDVFDEVSFACAATLGTHSAAALCAELCQRCALDVSQMRDGDYHFIIGIEVFGIELRGRKADFRAAFVAVLFLHLDQLVLDDLAAELVITQNLLEVGYAAFDFLILLMQFFLLYVGELCQAHVDDGLGLQVVEPEAFHECLYGGLRIL